MYYLFAPAIAPLRRIGCVLLCAACAGLWFMPPLGSEPPSPNDALFAAASDGDVHGMESALRNGASLSARDHTGVTPLVAAAGAGRVKAVEMLIDAGAAVDAEARGNGTALSAAASCGNARVVDVLLRHRATVGGRVAASQPRARVSDVRQRVGRAPAVLVGLAQCWRGGGRRRHG